MAAELFIGLMSGTSLDGVDGVLADFSGGGIAVRSHASADFPADLRAELLALNSEGGSDELQRAALAGNGLARTYARVVRQLLDQTGVPASQVLAIGAHGQTVRHRPGEFDDVGFTLQLNNPSLLAELSGIAVVADFRSRDLAAGGQGAPLVPAFHRALFSREDEAVAVLNLGGISNLSRLPAAGASGGGGGGSGSGSGSGGSVSGNGSGKVLGFDCGPGNGLMDHWCQTHRGQPHDDAGRWAASGRVLPELLDRFLAEPYFAKAPPKSTGRDLFNADWLAARLGGSPAAPVAPIAAAAPADVQATLAELTAECCARDLLRHGAGCRTLIVCGGGALNLHLMQRLQALLPAVTVVSSADRGLPPQQVEAAAFAWLARATLRHEPGNIASVTGARGDRVLGAIYPA